MVFLNSNSVRINIFSYISVRSVQMVCFFSTNLDYPEEMNRVLYDQILHYSIFMLITLFLHYYHIINDAHSSSMLLTIQYFSVIYHKIFVFFL